MRNGNDLVKVQLKFRVEGKCFSEISYHINRICYVGFVCAAHTPIIKCQNLKFFCEPPYDVVPLRDIGSKPVDQRQRLAITMYLIIHLYVIDIYVRHICSIAQKIGSQSYCHPERSEGSCNPAAQILRCAQDDNPRNETQEPKTYLSYRRRMSIRIMLFHCLLNKLQFNLDGDHRTCCEPHQYTLAQAKIVTIDRR